MATRETELVNLALSHLGEEPYDSIALDPPPPKLRKVMAQLPATVDFVLRRAPWLCAMTYTTLDPSDRAGDWKFAYVYELPATCVRLWEVQGACTRYEKGTLVIEGAVRHVIRSGSAGALQVGFVERKPLEALDADLFNAISFELAARCAGPIQAAADKAQALHREAARIIGLAMGSEAGEHGGDVQTIASPYADLRRLGAY